MKKLFFFEQITMLEEKNVAEVAENPFIFTIERKGKFVVVTPEIPPIGEFEPFSITITTSTGTHVEVVECPQIPSGIDPGWEQRKFKVPNSYDGPITVQIRDKDGVVIDEVTFRHIPNQQGILYQTPCEFEILDEEESAKFWSSILVPDDGAAGGGASQKKHRSDDADDDLDSDK